MSDVTLNQVISLKMSDVQMAQTSIFRPHLYESRFQLSGAHSEKPRRKNTNIAAVTSALGAEANRSLYISYNKTNVTTNSTHF